MGLLDLFTRWRDPGKVDVIVPVYRGVAETRACIESVLASPCRTPFELLVIDDRSPEPEISAWLAKLGTAGRITLIPHARNRGFVWSVNEGMSRHPDRDVVLLNSDTEVAPGWLDRLSACTRRDRAIGTATPFSTNATICSYPVNHGPNEMPAGENTASMDAAFAAANAGRSADIPTAVGFCMYITRRCLARVGPFDYERYGAGYGEEVDFCMRAGRMGFRNVIAADVFVHHVGEVSFQGSGMDRREKAQAMVDALYPEFQQLVRTFIPADPLRVLRRRADIQRLRSSPAELRSTALAGGYVHLDWPREGEEFALWLHAERDRKGLAAVQRALADPTAPLPELEARWLSEPLVLGRT